MKSASAPRPSAAQSRLIDNLGGPTAVSKAINTRLELDPPITPQAVSMWKVRGIPYRYRACLTIVARDKSLRVPDGFLGEQAPDADVPAFLREA